MNRQKTALALLLVVFAVALAYSFLGRPKQKRAGSLKYAPGTSAESYRTQRGGEDTRVRLDLLDRDHPRFSGFRRNIFRSIFYEPVKTVAVPKSIPVPVVPPPPPPPVEKTPAQIAMEEVGQFAFLGYLQKDNLRTVFLTKNNQIFLVKKGDKIAGRYEVADITENMLTISLAQGGEQVVIPLQQNRPLTRGTVPAGRGRIR
jgi:hypothetical protein